MGKNKQLAVNMIAQILAFGINLLINFFVGPFIVNHLGQEVFGFVGLATNFTSYISIFTIALNGMLGRYVTIALAKKEYRKASQYFSSVTICNILLSLILLIPMALVCLNLEHLFNISPRLVTDVKWLWALVFLAFLITLAGSSFATSTFASNRLDMESRRQLESYVIRAVLLIVLFSLFAPHVWYVGIATLACGLFIVAVNIQYTHSLTPQLKLRRRYFKWSAVKELVGVGLWNSVNQLSQVLLHGLDLLITNLFISPGIMGLLQIAKTVPMQLQVLIATIANVFAPQMTYAYAKGDLRTMRRETRFAMKVCGFLCSVPIIGFIILGEPFFRLWMVSLTPSDVKDVQILSILTLLPTLSNVFIEPLYNVNTITCKLKVPVIIAVCTGFVSVPLILLLLKTTNLGAFAVAGVSAILLSVRYVIFTPMYAAHNLHMRLTTFFPPLVRGAVASIIMGVCFKLISAIFSIHTWPMLILVAIICAAAGYAIGLFLLFNHSERQKLFKIIKDKLLSRSQKTRCIRK